MNGVTAPAGENLSAPLWQVLQATALALGAVRQGRNHRQALARVSPTMRPATQALLFAVLRAWGRAMALRQQLVARAPKPAVDDLLCVGLALALPASAGMYPLHTLFDQMVEAAKQQASTRAQAGLINACLRRFDRERSALMAATDGLLSARWNHPDWWVLALQADHPKDWQTVLQASAQAAPLAVRVNRRQITREALQALWASQGHEADSVGEDGLVLTQARPVQHLPGYEEGWFSVQDPGAQWAAPLLLQGLVSSPHDRPRVLDACAAPGGKTAHLLERADLEVLALDVDEARCARTRENLQRLRLQAEVRCADAAHPEDWWDGRPWHAILLDAPCSASGIVRRHPDIPWLRRATDMAPLVQVQQRLLKALWPTLAPGGRLLYCTCSVFHAEGQAQIQAFLANNTDARLRPSPGSILPGLASKHPSVSDNLSAEHDGFFYALLEKQ
mgnify:FL=1